MINYKTLIEVIFLEDNFEKSDQILHLLAQKKAIHKIYMVRDGIEAVDILKNNPKIPKTKNNYLVIIDMNSAYSKELLAEIKNNNNLKIMPVVLITSKTEEELIETHQLPSNYYVIKDCEIDLCLDIVDSIENFTLTLQIMEQNITHKHLSYML